MLFVVNEQTKTASPAETHTFSSLSLKERFDIQEWVLTTPRLLGEDLLIVTTEFDQFDKTSERLDVLAVDSRGKLVVAELKRSAVGTAADLQALRYAAYCSTLGIDDLAELYQSHVRRRSKRELSAAEARAEIEDFIEDPAFEEFDDKPRIVLAAEEFPAEVTATLLWLRSFNLDVSAVRLRPYRVGGQLLVDSSILIPLQEAEDFLVRREKKEVRQTIRANSKGESYRTWFQPLIDQLRDQHGFTNARIAQPQNWYSFSSGTAGILYSAAFTHQGLRVEVYIDVGDRDSNKAIFDRFLQQSQEIEHAFGGALSWERLEERRASRVGAYRLVQIDAPEQELEEARVWATNGLLRLKEVFGTRLSK
jgi:uncharacterized protein DUF4268